MDHQFTVVENGLFSFSIREDGNSPWWWDLDLGEKPLYRLGNLCGTCATIFRLINNADLPLAPNELSQLLENGIQDTSSDINNTVSHLLPSGQYSVQVITIRPSIKIKENDDYKLKWNWDVDYLWENNVKMKKAERSVEYDVIFPIIAQSELMPDRVKYYEEKLKNGSKPTALALTIEDERAPRGNYQETVTAHILLDGHHKVMAASRLSYPITVLSYNYHKFKGNYPVKSGLTQRAPDAGESAHIPNIFARLIIFLAGRLRRPPPQRR